MFLITVRGRTTVFYNKPENDFMRFLPQHFRCEPSDMVIQYVPKSLRDSLAVSLMDNAGADLRIAYDDVSAKVFRVDQVFDEESSQMVDQTTLVSEATLVSVAYPYSKSGIFKRPKLD